MTTGGEVIGVAECNLELIVEDMFKGCAEVLENCEVLSADEVVGRGEGFFKEDNLNILVGPIDVFL